MAVQTQNEGASPVAKEKNKNPLKLRAITAAVYVAVWALMFAIKWCVPAGGVAGGWGSLGFDMVFCAISVIGAMEFLRAIDRSESGANCKISFAQRAFTLAFCAVCVPLFAIMEMIPQTNGSGLLAVACAFTVYLMFLAATSVFDHNRSSVKGTIYCVFCMLYCGVLSTMLSAINHLNENSMAGLLFLFACAVLTDTGAYAIGSALKKYVPLKLAPQLSPNKTVIGAVGGIIGGIIGAIIAYYLMYICGGVNGQVFVTHFNGVELTFNNPDYGLFAFIMVGLFTAVICHIGDLFESAIKRECGIKDMGNLLPGHGGVLDRFDSMLYCSVVVLFCFSTII